MTTTVALSLTESSYANSVVTAPGVGLAQIVLRIGLRTPGRPFVYISDGMQSLTSGKMKTMMKSMNDFCLLVVVKIDRSIL